MNDVKAKDYDVVKASIQKRDSRKRILRRVPRESLEKRMRPSLAVSPNFGTSLRKTDVLAAMRLTRQS